MLTFTKSVAIAIESCTFLLNLALSKLHFQWFWVVSCNWCICSWFHGVVNVMVPAFLVLNAHSLLLYWLLEVLNALHAVNLFHIKNYLKQIGAITRKITWSKPIDHGGFEDELASTAAKLMLPKFISIFYNSMVSHFVCCKVFACTS